MAKEIARTDHPRVTKLVIQMPDGTEIVVPFDDGNVIKEGDLRLDLLVEDLPLSPRAKVALEGKAVRDVVVKTRPELLGIPGMGPQEVENLRTALAVIGLRLGMQIAD